MYTFTDKHGRKMVAGDLVKVFCCDKEEHFHVARVVVCKPEYLMLNQSGLCLEMDENRIWKIDKYPLELIRKTNWWDKFDNLCVILIKLTCLMAVLFLLFQYLFGLVGTIPLIF